MEQNERRVPRRPHVRTPAPGRTRAARSEPLAPCCPPTALQPPHTVPASPRSREGPQEPAAELAPRAGPHAERGARARAQLVVRPEAGLPATGARRCLGATKNGVTVAVRTESRSRLTCGVTGGASAVRSGPSARHTSLHAGAGSARHSLTHAAPPPAGQTPVRGAARPGPGTCMASPAHQWREKGCGSTARSARAQDAPSMSHSGSGARRFQNLLERPCSLRVRGELTSLPGGWLTPASARR